MNLIGNLKVSDLAEFFNKAASLYRPGGLQAYEKNKSDMRRNDILNDLSQMQVKSLKQTQADADAQRLSRDRLINNEFMNTEAGGLGPTVANASPANMKALDAARAMPDQALSYIARQYFPQPPQIITGPNGAVMAYDPSAAMGGRSLSPLNGGGSAPRGATPTPAPSFPNAPRLGSAGASSVGGRMPPMMTPPSAPAGGPTPTGVPGLTTLMPGDTWDRDMDAFNAQLDLLKEQNEQAWRDRDFNADQTQAAWERDRQTLEDSRKRAEDMGASYSKTLGNIDVANRGLSAVARLQANPELFSMVGGIQGREGNPLRLAWQMFSAEASDVDPTLDNLRAVLSIDTLNALKSQSATGATGFGALSENELKIIQDAVEVLNTTQSDEGFMRALDRVAEVFKAARERSIRQWEGTYGADENARIYYDDILTRSTVDTGYGGGARTMQYTGPQ